VCEHWNGEHSLYPGVGMCTECGLQEATINLLHCSTCGQYCHRHYTGVGKRGIPAGVHTCASCLQSRAKLPSNALAQKLSKELVQLTAQPVQLQSQDTYYYALKRFQKIHGGIEPVQGTGVSHSPWRRHGHPTNIIS
jgi:hypothetical protein